VIAVLGIGGVGGFVAARTGALCVASDPTAAVIADHGLRLVHGPTTTTVRPAVVTELTDPVSLLVVAVKAASLAAAVRRVSPGAVAGAAVLPLLNGLEHVQQLRRLLPGSTVVAGSIGRFEGLSPEPGVVVQRSEGALIRVASDALAAEALDRGVAPLRVTGIDVVAGGSEAEVLWEKAARLAVLAASTVASGRTVGVLRSEPRWAARMRTALDEACAAASAEGVPLDPAAQWAVIEALPVDLTTSAARDAAAGRPTELDAIAGSVLRAAVRTGTPTPTLGTLVEEAEAAERKGRRPGLGGSPERHA
jgi:2-dehydropantoate 2-reductase